MVEHMGKVGLQDLLYAPVDVDDHGHWLQRANGKTDGTECWPRTKKVKFSNSQTHARRPLPGAALLLGLGRSLGFLFFVVSTSCFHFSHLLFELVESAQIAAHHSHLGLGPAELPAAHWVAQARE